MAYLHRLRSVLLIVVSSILFSLNAFAETPLTPRILVLDASNSMTAIIDGKVKLDIARDVIEKEVATWGGDQPVAVFAYGHRRKGDCTDIEQLVSLAPLKSFNLHQSFAKLSARGKTPLSAAIEQAANSLNPTTGGEILLVTDGIETCDRDPCAVAEALHKAHANLRIHVVGFGIGKGEATQLSCIAEKGGGKFAEAGKPLDLKKSLETVKQAMVDAPPLESEPPKSADPLPVTPAPVTFRLVSQAQALLSETPVKWVVSDPTTGEVYFDALSKAATVTLKPGDYKVKVSVSNASSESTVKVTPQRGATYDVKLDVGEITLNAIMSKRGEPIGNTENGSEKPWALEPLDQQGAVNDANLSLARPAVVVAPGRYLARLSFNGFKNSKEIAISPAEKKLFDVSLGLGKIKLLPFLKGAEQPIEENLGMSWAISSVEGKAPAQTTNGQAQPEYFLPAGSYKVEMKSYDTVLNSQTVSVEDGADKTERINVPSGKIKIQATFGEGGAPIEDWREANWFITAPDKEPTGDPIIEAMPERILLPGKWNISYQSGSATAKQEITVAPGDDKTISVVIKAARIGFRAKANVGSETPSMVCYEIAKTEADGTEIGEKLELGGHNPDEEVTVILPEGKAKVFETCASNPPAETAFEVKTGAAQTIEVQTSSKAN